MTIRRGAVMIATAIAAAATLWPAMPATAARAEAAAAHARAAGRAQATAHTRVTARSRAAPAAKRAHVTPTGSASWSGASASDTWSTPGNWSAGTAPSGGVGQLSLPAAGSSCVSWECGFGVDDLGSLSVGTLAIDSSADHQVVPLDAGDQIQLLSGLSFTTTAIPTGSRQLTNMVVPLTLGAPQTWSISGTRGTPTQLTLGAVTGERYPLTLKLTNGVLVQAPELDTGPLTISGAGTVALAQQTIEPADGIPASPPPLIGAGGVRLSGGGSLVVTSPGAVSGPITVAPGSYSTLEIGHGVALDGTVAVNGDVTLSANSTVDLWIDQPATTGKPQASTDNSQLTAFGDVNLGSAGLNLSQGYTNTQVACAALKGGQTYRLISASKLTGSFDHLPNGQVVVLGACQPTASGPSYAAIVSYNTRARPQTVTATIVGPKQITALVARTLRIPAGDATLPGLLSDSGYSTSFDAPAAGTLALTLTAVAHGRRVTVATASNVAGKVGLRPLSVKLTAAGRRLLHAAAFPPRPKPKHQRTKNGKKHRRHRLPPRPKPRPVTITSTARFTPTAQSTVVATRRIVLR